MQNSRLIHIIKTFSSKEIRDFRKWITSPAHNTREDVVTLFEYLTTGEHLQKEKFLLKERIYPKIYPKEPFDDAKMRQVIHFLMKTIENFLIYRELLADEVRAKITLASVYRKRKLDKSCEKILKNIKQIQVKQPYKNEHFHRNEYILEQESYNYLSGFERTNLNLQEMTDKLDVTYFADKLQHCCLMLAHQSVAKIQYNHGMILQLMKYVEDNNYLKYPAIAIYYFGYKSITEIEEDEYYFKLKDEIAKHSHLFPKNEIRTIILMSINYCIKKMNRGKKGFIREAFELYKNGVEKQVLIENGIISRVTFLNIVINGTQLKEFDWVEMFIQDYQKYLKDTDRKNIVTYSFASLYYEKNDYDASMEYLMQHEINDVLLNLNSKSLLIKMYYEQSIFDPLESLLESMRTYLQRKKIVAYHRATYSNIIKLTKKLLKVRPYDKNQRANLKSEIESTQPLTSSNRKWLLDQLAKL